MGEAPLAALSRQQAGVILNITSRSFAPAGCRYENACWPLRSTRARVVDPVTAALEQVALVDAVTIRCLDASLVVKTWAAVAHSELLKGTIVKSRGAILLPNMPSAELKPIVEFIDTVALNDVDAAAARVEDNLKATGIEVQYRLVTLAYNFGMHPLMKAVAVHESLLVRLHYHAPTHAQGRAAVHRGQRPWHDPPSAAGVSQMNSCRRSCSRFMIFNIVHGDRVSPIRNDVGLEKLWNLLQLATRRGEMWVVELLYHASGIDAIGTSKPGA